MKQQGVKHAASQRPVVSDLKGATNVNKVCDGGGAGRTPAEPAGQVGELNIQITALVDLPE